MSWLLYPLVQFAKILYDNELPGRPRTAGADYTENVEVCNNLLLHLR